jgi:hypothetical protein
MNDDLYGEPAVNKPLIGVAAAVIVAALAGGYYWYAHSARPEKEVPAEPPAAASAVAPSEPIQHPVPSVGTAREPLPDLRESDKPLVEALREAVGGAAVAAYLVPEAIVRHVVVTVDNLPRQKLPLDKRPIVPAPGTFAAKGDELHSTLDSANYDRYKPMIAALGKVDMQRLAAVYLRFYPLFQKSYQDLGYPDGYFNDRLVKVIDDLLATPEITGPIDLARPNVLYVFTDQTLESRSAGQKALIRMGPANAAIVKSKLGELRAIITAAPPAH